MKEVRYKIAGMRCDGCVARVRETLASVPGVTAAEVDLAGGSALVRGDADSKQVIEALTMAGYPAAVDDG